MKDGMGFCRGTMIRVSRDKAVDIEKLFDRDLVTDGENGANVILRVKFMDIPVCYRVQLANGILLVTGGTQLIQTVRGFIAVRDLLNGEPLPFNDGTEVPIKSIGRIYVMIRLYKLHLEAGKTFLANGVTVK